MTTALAGSRASRSLGNTRAGAVLKTSSAWGSARSNWPVGSASMPSQRIWARSFHCRAVAVTRAPSARKRAASWLPMRPYPTTRHRLPSRACSVFSIATEWLLLL